MKKILIVFVVAMGFSVIQAHAQYVKVRPGFSIGISIGNNRPPYDDAIWIEPEWRWENGRYIEIPGHWERVRHNSRWVQGRWTYSHRGYRWKKGHWKY